jgi:hypothetical protein
VLNVVERFTICRFLVIKNIGETPYSLLTETENPAYNVLQDTSVSDLPKQARQFENETDLKLVSYSKLLTGCGGLGCKSGGLVLVSAVLFTEITVEGPVCLPSISGRRF